MERRCIIAVLPLLFAACADLQWQKAGGSAAALERDQSECQIQAQQRARSEAPLFGQPPPVGMDSRGRAVTGRAARYDTDRALIEHDLMRACMRERGYELETVEKQ